MNLRALREANLHTRARCSTRSAATSPLLGASSVRSRRDEIPYGGFATNPERPAGQPDRGGVRVHHGNARESLAEDTDSSRVQLHGDHPRPRSH